MVLLFGFWKQKLLVMQSESEIVIHAKILVLYINRKRSSLKIKEFLRQEVLMSIWRRLNYTHTNHHVLELLQRDVQRFHKTVLPRGESTPWAGIPDHRHSFNYETSTLGDQASLFSNKTPDLRFWDPGLNLGSQSLPAKSIVQNTTKKWLISLSPILKINCPVGCNTNILNVLLTIIMITSLSFHCT